MFILKEFDLPKPAIVYYQSIQYPRVENLRWQSGAAKCPNFYANSLGGGAEKTNRIEVEESAFIGNVVDGQAPIKAAEP